MTVEEALEQFAEDINVLAGEHGTEPVARALDMYFPGFLSEFPEFTEFAPELQESWGSVVGGKLGQAAVKKVKDALPKSRLGATLGAGALGAALGAASDYIDQDVDIASVSTDDALTVKPNADLEGLLKNTTNAIDRLTQVLATTQKDLGARLQGIDASVDDVVAADTGETAAQVSARQGLSMARPEKEKKQKPKSKKKEKAAGPGEE